MNAISVFEIYFIWSWQE